ncbi:MAG: hypothetical protein JXA09_13115 [Anaerolineae bacterium]|nr:hypothetical protein [Anaerolineae bacterium]
MDSDLKATYVLRVKAIVREIVATRTDEMDCPECHEHLDQYADLLLGGGDPHAVMPRLREHLESCAHCREEFEALLDALRCL